MFKECPDFHSLMHVYYVPELHGVVREYDSLIPGSETLSTYCKERRDQVGALHKVGRRKETLLKCADYLLESESDRAAAVVQGTAHACPCARRGDHKRKERRTCIIHARFPNERYQHSTDQWEGHALWNGWHPGAREVDVYMFRQLSVYFDACMWNTTPFPSHTPLMCTRTPSTSSSKSPRVRTTTFSKSIPVGRARRTYFANASSYSPNASIPVARSTISSTCSDLGIRSNASPVNMAAAHTSRLSGPAVPVHDGLH